MLTKTAIIIRGPAAVGKSSVADVLQKKLPHSAHLDIDLLKRMISEVSSKERTEIAHDVARHFASELATHGYNVIVEEIFREGHLEQFVALLMKAGFHIQKIFLIAPLDTLIERDNARSRKIKGREVITRLYAEIISHDDEVVIDVSGLSPEDVADKIITICQK